MENYVYFSDWLIHKKNEKTVCTFHFFLTIINKILVYFIIHADSRSMENDAVRLWFVILLT